jgi:hypothetical protein
LSDAFLVTSWSPGNRASRFSASTRVAAESPPEPVGIGVAFPAAGGAAGGGGIVGSSALLPKENRPTTLEIVHGIC